MRTIKLLKNTVQNYAWGSPTAISELLGEQNPSHEPRAELWMGAHSKAPSFVNYDGQWLSLTELIAKYPQEILGKDVALAFDNKLPYLFKVLAAAKPLSIQAHPSLNQAKEGFERETDQGIAIDAPNRNYKDDNHKPECICALSPFWAMYGFRNIPDILALMGQICPVGLAGELGLLKKQPDSQGLKRFFTDLMTMESQRQKRVVDEAVQNAHQYSDENFAFHWMTRLSNEYPTDIGIFAPLLLNLIELKPGEALFLPAGELHAYLEGVGMELMANSDNVLRGGLTPKHIDVPELLKVLNFRPRPVNILKTVKKNKNERVYAGEADEFVLSVVSVSAGSPYHSSESRSVEIMLCTEGAAYLKDEGTQEIINIKKGDSALIPAAVISYSITGDALIYKAAVP
jgi:mannose-6-phosphate isomerase